MTLLNCLDEFPEFTDKFIHAPVKSFEVDLKVGPVPSANWLKLKPLQYWASCLKAYEGQFRFPAVQRYLHDISGEMSQQLDTIASLLSYFSEVGQSLCGIMN
jgi:hypothetical protein